MEISSGFLTIGLLMTLAGVIMIYMSLRASPHELKEKTNGVIYVGPIPIVVAGSRKWIVAALLVTTVVMVVLFTQVLEPGLVG